MRESRDGRYRHEADPCPPLPGCGQKPQREFDGRHDQLRSGDLRVHRHLNAGKNEPPQRERPREKKRQRRNMVAGDAFVRARHLRGGTAFGGAAHVENRQITVGVDRVAAAVSRVVGRGELVDDGDVDLRVGVPQGIDDEIALGVGVGVDLVRNLPGEKRKADRPVVGSRREEVHALPAGKMPSLGRRPESDMVAPRCVAVDLLLVGEGLLAPKEVEVRHGRGGVGSLDHRGDDDSPRRAHGDFVGERPSGSLHAGVDVVGRSVDREVDGIA